MPIDFFAEQYRTEPSRSDAKFGINDGVQENGDEGLAYTTIDQPEKRWNAVVCNENERRLQFVPLDHNIVLHPTPETTYSLSDGMLYCEHWISFIELKVKKEHWIQKDIDQLRSTIALFCQNHDMSAFTHRLAYAVNRKHPSFHFSKKTEMQKFYKDTGFRLLIQRDIYVPPSS